MKTEQKNITLNEVKVLLDYSLLGSIYMLF